MTVLKKANNEPGVDFIEDREYPYYKKYQYKAYFMLVGASYTYYIKQADQVKNPFSKYSVLDARKQEIVNNLPVIKEFVNWRNEVREAKNGTIRIERDSVSVFTNDLQLLLDIKDRLDIKVNIVRVQKNTYTSVKYFVREPKHKYRLYFKSKLAPNDFKKSMLSIIEKSNLHPSNAFMQWLIEDKAWSWRRRYTGSSFFIEYDDESILSYLSLMHGDMLAEKYKLEKRPDNI